jgi:hypothetical protein
MTAQRYANGKHVQNSNTDSKHHRAFQTLYEFKKLHNAKCMQDLQQPERQFALI